ncbi:MAG: 4-hydroxy-2-oxoheptanedioate aldolase [Solirubrobacteraceae bacterium]
MSADRQTLSERLRGGERLLGLVVKMPCAQVIECAGHIGYDLIVIDCEHGPADTEPLEHHLRAADSVRIPVLVRVGGISGDEVLRALDAGAQGIVVSRVCTPEQAAHAVATAHYPPIGVRGLATSTRAGRYGLVDVDEHVRRARTETLVIAQVEDAAALAHARAIAAEQGIDAVFLGPTDLSMSLGYPGQLAHPVVVDAIEHVTQEVRAAGQVLVTLVSDEAEARAWWDRGAQVVLLAAPIVIAKRLTEIARSVRGGQACDADDALLEEVGP